MSFRRPGLLLMGLLAVAGCEMSKSSKSESGSTPAGSVTQAGGGTQGGSAAATPAGAAVTLKVMTLAEVKELVGSKKGKIVVVDAWSTYCEPCLVEFPGLVGLHKKYGPDKVACISLCADYTGGASKPTDPDVMDEPLKFLKSQGATFDNVLSADKSDDLYAQWKFNNVPGVFVFDREGNEIKRFVNEAKYTEIEAYVASLLKQGG